MSHQRLPDGIENQLAAMQQSTLHPHDWRVLERLIGADLASLRAQVQALQQERDELLLDRHQRDRVSPCGHYRVFAMPCVLEDGTERPSCMQCDRDAAQDLAYWQPIERAPKDGTEILTFCPNRGYGKYVIRRWRGGEKWACECCPSAEPTHWKPLEPPTPDAAALTSAPEGTT